MTHLIRSLNQVPSRARGGVATMGNFDGVHLGHQALIRAVVEAAKRQGRPSVVVTFEPHPFEFFSGDKLTIPRITRFREKFRALSALGCDYVLLLKFNQELASISASDFVNQLWVQALAIQSLIVGDDFHFGRDRAGNIDLLVAEGKAHGFSAEAMPTFLLNGERVSSTRVRAALVAGDLAGAAALLGRPFTLEGRVRLGAQLGRQWGFPTANIYPHRRLTPVKGIFTVKVHGLAQHPLVGVANVGTRPTVDGTRTLLEVHLHDFNRNIYGHDVIVEFCTKLRDEVRFSNIDALREQIANDVLASHDYFKRLGLL
ncbi:MAG TPA: bifunctional riboflavin kinase/FAD synthetase [Gammaproteobacteria bacterium]|nr:bifunctional riboflavin kinase/FAD synthetase [Gammaproteobacteria bacterium]